MLSCVACQIKLRAYDQPSRYKRFITTLLDYILHYTYLNITFVLHVWSTFPT